MTWLSDRAVRILGVLCLVGQGILVYVSSNAGPDPVLKWPGFFLFLTVIQVVSLAFGIRQVLGRSDEFRRRMLMVQSGFLLLAVGALLSCGLIFLVEQKPLPVTGGPPPMTLASTHVSAAGQALGEYPAAAEALLQDFSLQRDARATTLVKGDWFRLLEPWPERWPSYFSGARALPAAFLAHRHGLPMAWTDGAQPLAIPPVAALKSSSSPLFSQQDGVWFLRSFRRLSDGVLIEIQVALAGESLDHNWPGVQIVISSLDQAPVLVDERGDAVAAVALVDAQGELGAVPRERPESRLGREEALGPRLMLGLVLAWLVALVLTARLYLGSTFFLVALWLGRGLLAGVDYFRWVPQAFPQLPIPAAPGSPISLVGPAYFATPFASGWFASTADALLTALVLGLTVWSVLRRWGLVGVRPVAEDGAPAWGMLGQGPVSGLLFGLTAVGSLWLLRFFAGLVAENANPRLIGQGVSLDFLSFWGLHVVLMVVSFSLAALLTGWAAARPWPDRARQGSWLGATALAAMVGGLSFLAPRQAWSGLPFLAASVVGGLWLVAPAFRSRPRFLRRFAWPAVLLLVVVWNYASLRQVYDSAERNWLVSKGQLITGTGEGWTRFLLEDALEGMREAEALIPQDGRVGGIWRDHPAYLLWQGSPLGDLGYACSVEIFDAEGLPTSFFATGFMRETSYELVSRGPWTDRDDAPATAETALLFQTERRVYPGGEEEILAAEIPRVADRGWIKVELPVRSWRISTLLADLRDEAPAESAYQPRSEVDRPILLLRGDDGGWLGTGDPGFDGPSAEARVNQLKAGLREWAFIDQGSAQWLCRWNPLPPSLARTGGEGFLLGLRRSGPVDNLLDLSRIMLINLVLLFLLFGAVQTAARFVDRLAGVPAQEGVEPLGPWLPGFQERFLAGYLLLGLLLLLVVGMSVDRVGYDRVKAEAREQTREGLNQTVAQLRSLLAEQAASLAGSEYITELLLGELAGQRTAGPLDLQQGMVYGADGTLLLDETLSDLTDLEAASLLAAGRNSPLVVIRDDQEIYVATVIPIDLSGVYAGMEALPDTTDNGPGHTQPSNDGFFFYRQRLDQALLNGLADLARGQATLYLDGQPFLASHPGPVFAGKKNLLTSPAMMASLVDHPGGAGVFLQPGRPFAFIGCQPLPSFARDPAGGLVRRSIPGVLSLAFPDRELQYTAQRRATVLFLAGLANLILLTALLLALLMSWNLFRPLRVLLTATRSLAEGDFDAPLPTVGKDEVGRLAGAFGLMRSQLHQARERLAAREQFLTTVLDQVTVGVAVLDRGGQVVALNPAGRHILTDFHPELGEKEAARQLLERFLAEGGGNERWGGEVRSRDGGHTLRGAMAPLALPKGPSDIMLVFEDITEFLQTKKMAINAELARQVAHEIKNPLTPIQLSVQLLDQAWRDQHPGLDSIVPETVSRVLAQVDLLRSIASEFSLLGRPGELELEPLDLAALVGQVIEAYQGGQVASGSGFRVDIEERELPLVRGETDALRKILGNLMQNSLDARYPDMPLVIDLSWEVQPHQVTLVWTDNGQGLPPEVADRLFDPYFSTKSKGTGLGLAICRNLADRMGGTMTLANRPDGSGARATLTLPRRD